MIKREKTRKNPKKIAARFARRQRGGGGGSAALGVRGVVPPPPYWRCLGGGKMADFSKISQGGV